MTRPHSDLFAPFQFGPFQLRNRIVMAPVSRGRATLGVADGLHATYYAQRASAGLIIGEGAQILPSGPGTPNTPGLYTAAQIEGWRGVTTAVHEAGGVIFVQLWHVGRVSHPSLQPGGALPLAPSAIAIAGLTPTPTGLQPFVTPRALETAEIAGLVEAYGAAAANAIEAGFDGVEIHAANGYLIDQFLRDGSNQRTDRYGGSRANRMRFLAEVMEAVLGVVSAERVGIRLSPLSTGKDMHDSDPFATFSAVVDESSRRRLAYYHVVEGTAEFEGREVDPAFFDALSRRFDGPIIVNNGYDREKAIAACREGRADMVSFGRAFIANPDLPARLMRDAPLEPADRSRYEGIGAAGYTDYAALDLHMPSDPPVA